MTPTLLAFLDDVEHGRIPADEVRHRARLARNELTAPIEGVDVGRLRELLEKATPGPWIAQTDSESGRTEIIRDMGRDYLGTHPVLMTDRYRSYIDNVAADFDLVAFLRNNVAPILAELSEVWIDENGTAWTPPTASAFALVCKARDRWQALASTLPERVAEAVMGEREACAQLCDQSAALSEELGRDADIAINVAALDGERVAAGVLARMIRSRPAPAHPMADPPINDAAQSMINIARGVGPGSWTSDDVTVPTPPPADDSAVQRVVEAPSWVDNVRAFHAACDIPVLAVPQIPPADRVQLRRDLLEEEYDETILATDLNDIVEIADGLADIIVIAIGSALEYGIPLAAVMDAVHASNMAKVDPVTGKVRRRSDGKILKPEGWKPPDVRGVLVAHGAVLDTTPGAPDHG